MIPFVPFWPVILTSPSILQRPNSSSALHPRLTVPRNNARSQAGTRTRCPTKFSINFVKNWYPKLAQKPYCKGRTGVVHVPRARFLTQFDRVLHAQIRSQTSCEKWVISSFLGRACGSWRSPLSVLNEEDHFWTWEVRLARSVGHWSRRGSFVVLDWSERCFTNTKLSRGVFGGIGDIDMVRGFVFVVDRGYWPVRRRSMTPRDHRCWFVLVAEIDRGKGGLSRSEGAALWTCKQYVDGSDWCNTVVIFGSLFLTRLE